MEKDRRRVLLYGGSLILEGIKASLQDDPSLEILILEGPLENPLEELRRLHPAAILFDLESVSSNFPLAILQQPDLLLVGIDPATDLMLLWSGTHMHAFRMQDLLQAIGAPDSQIRDELGCAPDGGGPVEAPG